MNDDEQKLIKTGMEIALKPVTDIASDLLGLAGGDWLHEKRQRNRLRLQEKAAEELRAQHVEEPIEPSPSVAIPLLSAAQDESREELVGLWAKLLAAAANPSRERLFRRQYIDIVRRLEPLDCTVLTILSEIDNDEESTTDALVDHLNVEPSEVLVSLKNLVDLGVAQPHNAGDEYEALEWTKITPLGRELLRLLK